MPCRDEGRVTTAAEYQAAAERERRDRKWFEAALCALINELERHARLGPMYLQDILTQASREGDIELKQFWDERISEDRGRIEKKFNGMSKDELQLMRKMLNENLG